MKNPFIRKALPLLLLSIIFCSCSPAYRSSDGSGVGYSDLQVTSRIFKVSYQGGLSPDRDLVQCFALYRAAELMKDHGFERFRVLRSSTTSRPLYAENPIVVAAPHRMGGMHAQMTPHIRNSQMSYHTEMTIQALTASDIDDGVEIYNSCEVMRFLGDKIETNRSKSKKALT